MARILVIDDEASIRMMIRLALQKDGHTVEQAADGPEGLEKFGDGSCFDLVLLDQRMPGMEGLEVLRGMRERRPEAPIVMITAFGTIDLATEAMKEGATDFLRKPFTLEMLRGAVRAAVKQPTEAGPSGGGAGAGLTTLNGFRIESRREAPQREGSDTVYLFTVRDPAGDAKACSVVLPAYTVERVTAHTGREEMPGKESFWRGLSEEALANYVWQNASPPPEPLRVEDFTSGLRHWTDAVLAETR